MARNTWYRLDNVGKFYSSQAGSSNQTVFRYSATIADDIDPEALQRALEKTVAVFPNFNVCLRSGMFWHYLEQASEPPAAGPENLPICFGLHVNAKSVLFRVSYYRERINFEVSHMVSDGRGSLNFFKALIYAYVQERYDIQGVALEYDGSDSQKSENSFDKYYERNKAAATHAPKVYRLTGWRDEADPTYMEYHASAAKMLELARSYGVSMTSLLIAVIMRSIRMEMPRRDRSRAIRIDIPVDLRQFFESTTVKNFFGLAFVSYVPGENDESVESIAQAIHAQLKEATQAEQLKSRMNRMIALEKNPLLRLAPLFVKDIILAIANRLAARDTTTTVSNLGQIRIDERLAPYIRDVNILTSTVGLNFTLCSFGDDLSIGISTVYSNLDVVKNFIRYFSDQGIPGRVNINKTSEEVAEDRLEVKFETSVKRLGGQAPARNDVEDGSQTAPLGEDAEASHGKKGGKEGGARRTRRNKADGARAMKRSQEPKVSGRRKNGGRL